MADGERETLAAADLIPYDIIIPSGDEVIGMPYGVRMDTHPSTAVPTETPNGIVITHYVDSEKPFTVIRGWR